MQFSLFFFSSCESIGADKYKLLLESAKLADDYGLSAIWVPERHFDVFGGIFPSASIAATAISANTKSIKIRAGSVVLPLNNPIRVAEEWAMVDNLSQGRVGISFASGWHAQDFILAPENFNDRKRIMNDGIQTIKSLWKADKVKFPKDGNGQAREIRIYPTPIQNELECWLTSSGNPSTFIEAGEMQLNLLTHLLNHSINDLAEKIKLYKNAYNTKDNKLPFVTVMMHTFLDDNQDLVKMKVKRPLKNYLRNSLQLEQKQLADKGETLDSTEIEELLEFAFDKYYSENGLFGTSLSCQEKVQRLKNIGVDEIACLIDFGLPDHEVLHSIKYIKELQHLANNNISELL